MLKNSIKLALCALLLGGSFAVFSQNIAINLAGNAGNASAILDLSDASNANLGFLMPSVNLAATTLTPVAGLIVYNNNATYSFGKGFYYWSGSAWLNLTNSGTSTSVTLSSGPKGAILSNSAANTPAWNLAPASTGLVLLSNTAGVPTWGTDPAIATSWEITGNGNITDGTNFIGTTTTAPINFQINGNKAGRIDGIAPNTFIGYQSGNSTTSSSGGSLNVGVGDGALFTVTSATRNTAIGSNALYFNTGSYNTAVGRRALYMNTSGTMNIGIGPNCIYTNTTGSYNNGLGNYALYLNVAGSSNNAYGCYALYNNLSSMNTALGDSSLATNTTGTNNTAVGFKADVSATGLTNATAIGNGASVSASNTMVMGNHSVTALQFNGALMPYYGGTYNAGTNGQVLTAQASGAPQWVTPAASGISGANDGLSTSGSNAILGGLLGTPSNLTQNTEIGMNGHTLTFSVASPNTNTTAIGVDLATNTAPAQALEIGGTANSIRIDGLQFGNTFNVASAVNTNYIMYANANGDLNAIPAGTANYVLTQTSSGPQWQPGGGGSISGTAGGVFYGTGGSYGVSAAGGTGNVLMSNGSGAPTWGTPSTSVISANNGLSMSGSNVQLGGNPLIANTSIALATYSLSIDGGPIVLSPSSSSTTTIGGGGTSAQNITINGGNTGIVQLAAGTISGSPNAGVDINWGTNTTTYINCGPSSGTTKIASTGSSTGTVIIGNSTGFTGINQASPKSTLDNNGSFGTAVVSATTSYTLDATSNTCLATAGTYTITLPAVATATGRLYNIVYNGTSNNGIITIQGNGTDNIITNGASSNTFYIAGGSVTLQSNGTNWYVVTLQPSVYSNVVFPVTTNTYTYSSSTDFSVNSTAMTVVTGSSLTLCPGTYQITASADFSNDGSSQFSQIALVNTTGTLYYGNIYDYQHTVSVYSPWSVTITVTLTATTTYKIECADISSGPAYCRNARINALRVQ